MRLPRRRTSPAVTLDIPPASSSPEIVWTQDSLRGELVGSGIGLGCSSNATRVACTYGAPVLQNYDADDLVLYDYDGNVKYRAKNLLSSTAIAGAPLFLDTGTDPRVVATDNAHVVLIKPVSDEDGGYEWYKVHDSGTVMTSNDVIVLAGNGQVVSAFDPSTGNPLDTLRVEDDPMDSGEFYATRNTPAVSGNRVYISMQHYHTVSGNPVADDNAILAAIDVDPEESAGNRLSLAWTYAFDSAYGSTGGVGSKSSPLIMDAGGTEFVFFDGYKVNGGSYDSAIFAVDEDGDEQWVKTESSTSDPVAGPPFA
jgi:hypothetical protein